MKKRLGFCYRNMFAPFFITAFLLCFAAGSACALPEFSTLDCEESYGFYGNCLNVLTTPVHPNQSLPLENRPAPDAIQNRTSSALPVNILQQRHRQRLSSPLHVEQLYAVHSVRDNMENASAYVTSSKDRNFVLSPITYVKVTHKRE